MNLIRCYLRKNEVIVPTIAKADAGFYLDAEPVHIFALTDAEAIKKEIIEQMNAEEHEIPTPQVSTPGSVILEKLHIKSWQSFEKEAVMYTLHKGNDGANLYVTDRAANGLWSHNKDYAHQFPKAASSAEMANAIVERLVWQSQTEWPEKPAAMIAPPSS